MVRLRRERLVRVDDSGEGTSISREIRGGGLLMRSQDKNKRSAHIELDRDQPLLVLQCNATR